MSRAGWVLLVSPYPLDIFSKTEFPLGSFIPTCLLCSDHSFILNTSHSHGFLYLTTSICRLPVPRPTSLAPAAEAPTTKPVQAI